MNFEELKSDWNKEPDNEVYIPESMEKFRKSNLPIEQVKIMMRKELFMQILGLVFIGFLPIIPIIPKFPYTLITDLKLFYMIYSFMFIISIFFIKKFYIFYLYLNDTNVNTKDSLYEIYYELKLNLESYKTWSYTITPLFVIIVLQIWKTTARVINPESTIFDNIYFIGSITLLCALYMYWATDWWLNKKYGLHLSRLKTILFDLKDDEKAYESKIKLENENSIGFLQLKKISKNDWLKIALIIGILFSIGFAFGTWLAKNGY